MISLAYIVQNEEAYIARSIKSAMEIADEIVVVDGGSTDRTVALCQALGAKVFTRKWSDDFGAQKNHMISCCTEPWILNLDADEHLEGEDLGLLTKALQDADPDIVAYQLRRKNHYPLHESDSPFFTAPFYPDLQTRLFRNHPSVFFSGRVHEGVVQSIEVGQLGRIEGLPLHIHHHMFRGDQEKNEGPKGAYYAFLEEQQRRDL